MNIKRGLWIGLVLLGCDSREETASEAPPPALPAAASADAPKELPVSETDASYALLRRAAPALVAQGAAALGTRCRALPGELQEETRERLLARAASLGLDLEGDPARKAWSALAQALTLCSSASIQALERVLRGWLDVGGEPGRAATRALGFVAAERRSLRAETVIALLGQVNNSPEAAWFALSRLKYGATSLRSAALKVAGTAQTSSYSAEVYRLQTLARLHPESLKALSEVVQDEQRPPEIRRAALSALAAAGPSGERVLRKLSKRAPSEGSLAAWLAARKAQSKRLSPSESAWPSLVKSGNLRDQHSALTLLGRSAATPQGNAALASALGDENPGTVAIAARALRDSALRGASFEADRKLQRSLRASMQKVWSRDTLATQVALLEAVGALQVLSLRGKVESFCDSPWNAVRNAASQALAQLRSPRRCDLTSASFATPFADTADAELKLQVGELELTLRLFRQSAPRHFDRIVSLANAGWFEQNPLQYGDQVLQLGDPDGDGLGNGSHDTLPSEISPTPFTALSVGAAQLGLDSGSTQLFVTLADRPDLDLRYPHLGRASAEWIQVGRNATIESASLVILDPKP